MPRWYDIGMRKHIAIILLLVALALVGILAWPDRLRAPAEVRIDSTVTLKAFFNEHLSVLSSEKEVLGGKFYVTRIEAKDGAGTVWYEDGHNAFVADFLYSVDENGVASVGTFTVRE